jgi:hypothetical protein
MELVDSESGEQLAAAVYRHNLGEGAKDGSVHFSCEERFRAATLELAAGHPDGGGFVDAANERSNEDVEHIEATNFPYAEDK